MPISTGLSAQQTFTVDPGEVTTFTFDAATSALTVSTTPPG